MARVARKRYVVTGNFKMNNVALKGHVFQLVGECMFGGATKRPNGRKLLKGDRTHWLIQFNDKKSFRKLALPQSLFRVSIIKSSLDQFFEEVEEVEESSE